MNIGETAEASGISAKMIRYYEGVGLIASAHRSDSGYRIYSDKDVHVLKFIGRARDLGFKVEDIRDLLKLWSNRQRRSAQVKKIAEAHIGLLQQKIVELQEMAATLQVLVDSCCGDQRPDCPILHGLEVGKDTRHPASPPKFDGTPNRHSRKTAANMKR